ncbi:MAG: hypothetical protein D3922_10715, partial [Candidatus Electrothrix sp. AR1]|nr:hypothetical protein [Candidatus Electrothrix sp. AR1]
MALQRRLPGLCRDWLLPALERTLDRYAPEQGSLYIERLEIDAGAMSLERLEHDLAESVSQALEKALREQIPSNEHVTEEYGSGKVSHKTAQHSIEEALVFFLKTGQLPWSFRLPEGRNLEQAVLAIWKKAGQSGSGIQGTADTLRRVLRTESAKKRLTRQFTPTLLTLLTRLAPAGAAAMDNVLQVLNSSNLKPEERRSLERLLWENTLTR